MENLVLKDPQPHEIEKDQKKLQQKLQRLSNETLQFLLVYFLLFLFFQPLLHENLYSPISILQSVYQYSRLPYDIVLFFLHEQQAFY